MTDSATPAPNELEWGAPLSPAPLVRIEHAIKRLEEARSLLENWVAEHARVEPSLQSNPQEVIWTTAHTAPFDYLHFTFLVGECIHALRSALDNFAYDLARVYSTPRSKLKDVYFPVASAQDSWESRVAALSYLPSEMRERLRQVQPMVLASDQRSRHPIYWLNKLDIADKHHEPSWLNMSLMGVGNPDVVFQGQLDGETIPESDYLPTSQSVGYSTLPIVSGVEYARAQYGRDIASVELGTTHDFRVDFWMPIGTTAIRIDTLLDTLVVYVQDVMNFVIGKSPFEGLRMLPEPPRH